MCMNLDKGYNLFFFKKKNWGMKNEEGTVKAGEKWQQTEKQPLRSCFSKNLLWTTRAYMALSVAYRKSPLLNLSVTL